MSEDEIKPVVKKVCKHCGTENLEDFIKKNGKGSWINICSKCYCDNLMGENNGFFGKHHSPEHCKRQKEIMSDGRRNGENNPFYGKHHSPEFSDNMSDGRRKGKNHYLYNKHHTRETTLKQSRIKRLTFEKFKEKYIMICLTEEMRELPYEEWEVGKSIMQFKCKKCNSWFTPTRMMVNIRNKSLNHNKDNNYFYCSDECKYSCSLFGLKPNNFLNNLNKIDNGIDSFGISTWKKEVFSRQLKIEWYNHCELCYSTKDLNVHHEKPQKTHSHLSLDPDNGIILCGTCHRNIGHTGECSTGHLANMICSPIINEINSEVE